MSPDSESTSYARRILQRMEDPAHPLPAIPGLSFFRFDEPAEPESYLLEPSICFILQGTKRIHLGENVYSYDSDHFLVTPIDLPTIAEIQRASTDQPYLGLALQLDPKLALQYIIQEKLPRAPLPSDHAGLATAPLTAPMRNALHRLLDLIDEPEHISALAPLIQQEILYRALTSPAGPSLLQTISGSQRSYQIGQVIESIKSDLSQSLRIDDLARQHGMSPSTLHHHFKSLTAMSPLQYQKHLRLNAARGLMLNQGIDAANAAFQVGYESPSQFSREYNRLFGAPPLRDIKTLRQKSSQ
ncbi:transcriptional regulator, AraC family [Rubritalea squalenifaciens DSM 18772]|uniref:Transcriptional regulator, AraC family n=2 Tax=Rubritalea squalenifaciens TaxID=407226 RepID=A0A1M6C7Y1_9BACT|nr:transcriptional regulator, AraC family [Rubritalea squalenifaciens DSM 18772]